MSILIRSIALYTLFFLFVFFMTYGHLNSGLVYARYGVLLTLIVTIGYLLLTGVKIIKVTQAIEYWYLGSILFILIGSLITFNTDIMMSALNYTLFSISIYILFRTILFYQNTKLITVLAKMVVMVACVSIIVGVYVLNVGSINLPGVTIEYDIFFSKRMNSWFNNSTVLGLYICIALCFLIYLDDKRIVSRFFYWCVIIIFIAGLILSGGRTGAILAILAFVFMKSKMSPAIIYGIIISSLIIVVCYINLEYLSDNIYFFRRLLNSSDSGLGGRDEKLEFTLELLSSYDFKCLLFGRGIGSVSLLSNYSIHSGLFREILEYGIPFTLISLVAGFIIIIYARLQSHQYVPEFKLISTLFLVLILADTMVTSLWGVSIMSVFYCFSVCAFANFSQKKGVSNGSQI